MAKEIHISSKGVQVDFPAGYLNRKARRKMPRLKYFGMPARVAFNAEKGK